MDGESPTRRRRRRTPDEARAEAIRCARRLLIAHGPDGVTLQAVAREIGVTHGNLIHHFGSAAHLQSSLMGAMVRDLTNAIENAVAHVRSDEDAARALVDILFDAFGQGGAGALAAWIALSNHHDHLEPIRKAIGDLVSAVDEKIGATGGEPPRHASTALLFVTFCAIGDALIGPPLMDMLGHNPETVRGLTARLLPAIL